MRGHCDQGLLEHRTCGGRRDTQTGMQNGILVIVALALGTVALEFGQHADDSYQLVRAFALH